MHLEGVPSDYRIRDRVPSLGDRLHIYGMVLFETAKIMGGSLRYLVDPEEFEAYQDRRTRQIADKVLNHLSDEGYFLINPKKGLWHS